MGGQQFGDAAVLVDTRALDRVLELDAGTRPGDRGGRHPVAGAPRAPRSAQRAAIAVGISQKQTGADRLTHRRRPGLQHPRPRADHRSRSSHAGRVASTSSTPDGRVRDVSSQRRMPDLFRLAIGGYGLFGVITRVQLRLAPRVQGGARSSRSARPRHRRSVFERRIRRRLLYGDSSSPSTRPGATSSTAASSPATSRSQDDAPLPRTDALPPGGLGAADLYFAHADKRRAFEASTPPTTCRRRGRSTGPTRSSSAAYADDYHAGLDRALGATVTGSEMITELYVPRPRSPTFMPRRATTSARTART